ncbi:MAG: trigger factor [Lachnospiraceae bacterium]|nr:trigger factor [Lachnospiraceae bacterium]MCR5375273.1 trigger factor [Lachnospiraceae bacterium]
MGCQVEDLGKNMVKLTIDVTAEAFEDAIHKAFDKNKNKIGIQGFRKGKAPFALVVKMYGKEMFYEDAANLLIPDAYDEAAKNCGFEIVSRPEIDVTQIESGKPFIFTATVAKKPEVTLGEYKGLEIAKKDIEVSDEEIDAEIKKEQEKNAKEINIEDRAIVEGDTATIDYEGFVDGVAFEGGKGENHPLVIGSHSFIPGFEEGLIGKTLGEECDVEVTFPEEYHAKELAGKAAVFKCKVNKITAKELPEIDDEFASEVSDYDTLAEYKESIAKTIREKKEADAKTEKENELVKKAIENATMEIPDAMIESTARQLGEEFAQRLQMQGLNIQQYFQYTGMTQQKYLETLKPQAKNRIETRLVLEAIADAEKIEISEEEMDAELQKMADQYQMELAKVKELFGDEEKKQLTQDLAVQKAITLLMDSAKEV